MDAKSAQLSRFLSAKVDSRVAPGLVAVAFSRAHGVTALAAGGHTAPTGNHPMDLNTTCWMASMSKAVNSLAALVLVEKHNFNLDCNDALAEVLPELKLGNGMETDFIFDGKDEEESGS
ncbi:hypothetical protein P7C70_g3966, partial [Phenoliferia sp. Uapishka_3]